MYRKTFNSVRTKYIPPEDDVSIQTCRVKWISHYRHSKYTRFEALAVATMKMTVFWDMTPCSLLYRYRHLGRNCCFIVRAKLYQTTRRHVLEGSNVRRVEILLCLYKVLDVTVTILEFFVSFWKKPIHASNRKEMLWSSHEYTDPSPHHRSHQ
jgi:hypothetical protein